MMDHFLAKVIHDFDQAFPYRNPGIDKSTLSEEEAKLQCSIVSWNGMRERLRNRFNHLKSRFLASKIEIGESIDLSPSAGPMPVYEPSESSNASDAAMEMGQPAPDSTHHDGPQAYRDDLRVPMDMVQSWQASLDTLAQLAANSWVDCDAAEIKRRQEEAPHILRDVLCILGRSTGCEAMAIGVTATPENHNVFRCATTRSIPYLQTPECLAARNGFVTYTNDALGSSLCSSLKCPGPVVYPNIAKENHPVCPQEAVSVAENRQWQGGGVDVPYGLIAADGESEVYAIVRREVMPLGYSVMRNPLIMEEEELRAWVRHLRAGDNDVIPAEQRFQFTEPRPGHRFEEPVVSRPDSSELSYHPCAWAYAWYVSDLSESEPPVRNDGLPCHSSDWDPYISITEAVMVGINSTLTPEDPVFNLVAALDSHDKAFPVEATPYDWTDRVSNMPHLKSTLPIPDSGLEHFEPGNGWFLGALLDFMDPQHFQCSITAIANWCNAQQWRHEPSGTLLGGYLGVKWAVLIIILLRINIARFTHQHDEFVEYYGPDAPGFIDRDIQTVNFALRNLLEALQDSTAKLGSSLPARMITNLETQANLELKQAHNDLPFPRHPEPSTDTVEQWEDDPWTSPVAASDDMQMDEGKRESSEPQSGQSKHNPAARQTPPLPTAEPSGSSTKKIHTRRNVILSEDGESESEKSQSPAQAMKRLDISHDPQEAPALKRAAVSSPQESSRPGQHSEASAPR
ncbi:hypothetical protein FRC11_010446, partial [Ceratobasidium sp. 423]